MGGADQERPEVAGVVRIGDRRRRRGPDLTEERTQPRRQRDDVVRSEGEDRVLNRVVGQRRKARRLVSERLGGRLRDGQPDRVELIEGDRVAIRERERRGVGATVCAANRLRADTLDTCLRPLRTALGTHRRAVGIAVEAPLHRLVVPRCGGQRCHLDVLDPDGDRVAHVRISHCDRLTHLMPAANRRRDHRPPAAGRGVPDDVAAVGDRPEHLDVGTEQAVGEGVDEDGLVGVRDGGFSGHGVPRFVVGVGRRVSPRRSGRAARVRHRA